MPQGLSAGTVTFGGGSIATPMQSSPSSPSNAYQTQAGGPWFQTGQVLWASAAGAQFPGFGQEYVQAPANVTIQQPKLNGSTYVIPTSTDLPLAWSGAEPGAQVVVEGTASSGSSYFLCTFDALAGGGVVPVAMLKSLSGMAGGYFIWGQFTTTTFNAGPFTVGLHALPYAGASATFQ